MLVTIEICAIMDYIDQLIGWVAVNGWFVLAAQFIFSAAVQAIPVASVQDSKSYRFWYKFLHLLAGNIRVTASKPKGAL